MMGRWGDDGDRGCHRNLLLADGSLPQEGAEPEVCTPGQYLEGGGVSNHRMEQGFVEGKSGSTARESLLSASSRPWLLPSIAASGPLHARQHPPAPPDPALEALFLSPPVLSKACSNTKPFSFSLALLPTPHPTQKQPFLFAAANWDVQNGCGAFAVT